MTSDNSPVNADVGKSRGSDPYELPRQVSRSGLMLRADPKRIDSAVNPHVDRIFSRQMDLSIEVPKEHLVDLAETFHSRYRANESVRMDALKKIYDQLGRPKEVIIVLYCKNFFSLFENWLASCASHNIPVRQKVIAFTLDTEAEEKTTEIGIKNYCIDPEIYAEAGGASAFGDLEFARTMFYKNAVIADTLELGANVLFQDVDMIWLRDPFDYFHRYCRDHDLYIMFDGPNPMHRPLYVNTGFIYVSCNDASRALIETALRNSASIFQCRSHQKPFNQIMACFELHNVLAVKVLPQQLFLNGHLFNLERGVCEKAGDWQNDGYVVHYSWTGNREEKRQKIEKFGFNYLPDRHSSQDADIRLAADKAQ